MPRYTLFYDGHRSAQATAADVAVMKKTPGLKVLAQKGGLLLVSVDEKIMNEIVLRFQGWVASKEQYAVQPRPKRPSLAPGQKNMNP